MTKEEIRLVECQRREKHWKRWGPYLSERAWGTVREDYSPYGNAWEYLPHDHARMLAIVGAIERTRVPLCGDCDAGVRVPPSARTDRREHFFAFGCALRKIAHQAGFSFSETNA